MTDYAPDSVVATAGTVINQRTGTAAADTVPAGAIVLWRNTGAGTHNVVLTNSSTQDGLAVANRTITMTAGQIKAGRVNPAWGDANGRVAVAIDGTAAEVVYYVMGGA
jgi:plastocyanin